MEAFEPLIVDEKINKDLIRGLHIISHSNFKLTKKNEYTYYGKNIGSVSGKFTLGYLYVLLNEFTRQMYIGITSDFGKRMKSHAKDQVLGPNSDVILNATFILELEEILTDKRVLSINGQLWTIEQKLKKYMQELGYDARTRYDELDVVTENGFIEDNLVRYLEEKLIKEKVNEELNIIKGALEQFIWIVNRGGYHYFSYAEFEPYHKFTKEELQLHDSDVRTCKELLAKHHSKYSKSEWELVQKILEHRGLRISLWEQGIGDPRDLILLKNVRA